MFYKGARGSTRDKGGGSGVGSRTRKATLSHGHGSRHVGIAGQIDEGGGGDSATSSTQRAFPVCSNDFVNKYYLPPFSVRSHQFATQDYVPNRKILMVLAISESSRLHSLWQKKIVHKGTHYEPSSTTNLTESHPWSTIQSG